MRTLHIGDVINAIEMADDDSQAFYLPSSGEITWDQLPEGTKYIPLPGKRERNDYHTMELFIESLDDPEAQDWLDNAIRGKGAFRRFRGACEKFHLLNDWYDFEYQTHVDLAVEWCEDHGIVYDMEMDEEEDEAEEDVADFYRDDFKEEKAKPVKEEVHNPVHMISITGDNLMNALYAADGYRREVMKQASDLEEAEKMLQKALDYGCIVIGASDQGRIVGLAVYEKTMEETILRMLFVMKDMRHRGIGTMLVKYVGSQTEKVVAEVPERAAGFFNKMNYEQHAYMSFDKMEERRQQ